MGLGVVAALLMFDATEPAYMCECVCAFEIVYILDTYTDVGLSISCLISTLWHCY